MIDRTKHENWKRIRERLAKLEYPAPMVETAHIETAEPEKEPEYVGAHSMLVSEECGNVYDGDPENTGRNKFVPVMCDRDATHTVVMADGSGLHEVAMCDDCGSPDDVDNYEREWSGEIRESGQSIRRSAASQE